MTQNSSPASRPSNRSRNRQVAGITAIQPTLNPIEMAFAKLRTLVRKAAARTYDQLWQAVGHVCDLFTDEACYNSFKAAAYQTDQPRHALNSASGAEGAPDQCDARTQKPPSQRPSMLLHAGVALDLWRNEGRLQGFMGAVAKRCLGAVFAAAKIGGFAGIGGEFQRKKAAALVAAIAEGLGFGVPAGAPEIGFSLDQIDGIGGLLGDMGRV